MASPRIGIVIAFAASFAFANIGDVAAQSFNIDYSNLKGSPSNTFAAAGVAGHWNVLTGSNSGNNIATPLLGLNGSATAATLAHTNLNFFVGSSSGVSQSPYSLLLGDYAGSNGPPFVLDFDGLMLGDYEVLTYTTTRQDFPATQIVTINNDPGTSSSTTGIWPGFFSEGASHTRHIARLNDGRLQIAVSKGNDPIVNGLQLRLLVPEPSAAWLVVSAAMACSVRRPFTFVLQ